MKVDEYEASGVLVTRPHHSLKAHYIAPRPPSRDLKGARGTLGITRLTSHYDTTSTTLMQPNTHPNADLDNSSCAASGTRYACTVQSPHRPWPLHNAAAYRRRCTARHLAFEETAAKAALGTLSRTSAAITSPLPQHDERAQLLSREAWHPLFLTAGLDQVPQQPKVSESSSFRKGEGKASVGNECSPSAAATHQVMRWRLRSGKRLTTPYSPSLSNEKAPQWGSRTSEVLQHPLNILLFLGSAIFNDAPLSVFLPSLKLHGLSGASNVAAEFSYRRCTLQPAPPNWGRRLYRPRHHPPCAETLAVHLGDVEARSYRVEVSELDKSPILSLVRAYHGCVWDGAEFFLIPLVDAQRRRQSIASPSPPRLSRASLHIPEKDTDREVACENGFLLDFPRGRALANTPDSFLQLTTEAFGCLGNEGGLDTPPPATSELKLQSRAAPLRCASRLSLNTADVREASTTSSTEPVVPLWKRFSTAAALYLALGGAGCCDVTHFPYIAVQLCSWDDLLRQPQTRIEMIASGSAAAVSALKKGTRELKGQQVPVAVMLPTSRKGVIRSPLSLTTQPFSDAEVFQLFYLQLLFRAYFDVRFRGMTYTLPGMSDQHLRSDLIAVRSSGWHPVAFEHPTQRDKWLRFPAHTRLLTLLNLEEVVVPLYATPTELQETTMLRLFGSGSTLPCVSAVGRELALWAATIEVHSPETAVLALAALFQKMEDHYSYPRSDLWEHATTKGSGGSTASSVPLLFRPGEFAARAALQRTNDTLSRFFVAPSRRATAAAAVADGAAEAVLPRRTVPPGSAASTSTGPTAVSPGSFSSTLRASTEPCVEVDSSTFAVATDNALLRSIGEHDGAVLPREPKSAQRASEHLSRVESAVSILMTGKTRARTGDDEPPVKVQLPHMIFPDIGTADLKETITAPPLQQSATFISPSSPFTRQESLVTRWRYYALTGNCAIFNGTMGGVEINNFLGRGGSASVYKGTYGTRRLPVAVKVFVIPDGMDHERYVRESLTDVAFYVLMNQLDDFGLCYSGRAHDFIVCRQPPKGLSAEAVNEARRGAPAESTKLCYLITDLMDGTIGRFLTESDDDFDPVYDQLVNSPLRASELFQFLFNQLAMKALFDWKVLDIMLNSQLRGDNIGYRFVALLPAQAASLLADPEAAAAHAESRQYYEGLLYGFQFAQDEPVQYLRFPAVTDPDGGEKQSPLRFICLVDVGQGMQPNVAELVRKHYIGETVLDSCVNDDGFGRYWPIEELYCRYVDVEGTLAKEAIAWGGTQRVSTQEDAVRVMRDLFRLYHPFFGVDAPSEEERKCFLYRSWTPGNIADLKAAYVYREE